MMGDRSRPKTGGMTPVGGKEGGRSAGGTGEPSVRDRRHTPTHATTGSRAAQAQREAREWGGGKSGGVRPWLAGGRQESTGHALACTHTHTPPPVSRPAGQPTGGVHRPHTIVRGGPVGPQTGGCRGVTWTAAFQHTAEEVEEGVTHSVER